MGKLGKLCAVAVLVGASLLGAAGSASAYSNGSTKLWADPGYVNYTYSSVWGGPDCNQIPGYGYAFYPGLYAGSRSSSLTVWPERQHCNYLAVRANTPSHPYWAKCVNVGDNGIPSFGAPWDNNVDAVVLQWNPGCPLFW